MRQDWIEFECRSGKKVLLRPEWISSICDNWDNTGCVMIGYDEHMLVDGEKREGSFVLVNEPYEQVKQKIIDAERVDLSDVVVEHFTRDDYETLLTLAECERDECEQDNIPARVKSMNYIIDKLNEILKEDK